jgi:hypothetical protein
VDSPDRTILLSLAGAGLDPDDFDVAVYTMRQPTGFGHAATVVTVTCRRLRISRTYGEDDYPENLAADIRDGVFTPSRPGRGLAA